MPRADFSKRPGCFCEVAHQAQLASAKVPFTKEPLEEQKMGVQGDAASARRPSQKPQDDIKNPQV